jgi:cbb3-type cytochrome oxidase maturation protein
MRCARGSVRGLAHERPCLPVPLALMLGLTGLAAFLWSLKSGQYDDLDGAAVRILPDDDIPSS